MAFDLAFVDQVAATPTYRLDLNGGNPLKVMASGSEFGLPELRRARTSTLLVDGDNISASAYGNRTLRIRIDLPSDKDSAATWFQKIVREVNRETNLLRYRAGTTDPVFFSTFRSEITNVEWDGVTSFCTIAVEAKPFAVGLKETLTPVTITNNPAAGSNGLFFDVTGIRGDVETPLFWSVGTAAFSAITVTRRTVIGVRRRGTPSSAPLFVQAESMTLGTDTTLPGADATASGSGSNYARVSTWTNTALVPRITADPFPAAAGVDVRGTYRVYARIRTSPAGGGGATAQLRWGASGASISNDVVPLAGVGSGWLWWDLGLVQYPLGVDPATDGLSNADLAVRGMRIAVAVSKGSTTTNVDIDYLVFVPADDLFSTVSFQPDSTATAAILDPSRRMAYMVGGSGEVRSTAGAAIPITGMLPYATPGVTNRFVVLLDINGQTGGDNIADTLAVTPYYWPQYAWVRPVGS